MMERNEVSTVRTLRKQLLKVPMVRPSYKRYLEYKTHQKTDVFLISFPKSGRTWLRVLIGKILAEYYDREFTIELETLADDDIPFIHMTHDGAEQAHKPLELNKSKYRNKKVAFLVRDPRDVVVSYYFQCTKRQNLYQGNISNFVRDPGFGIERIINFMNLWKNSQNVPEDFILLKYEDLHSNPCGELNNFLKFSGVHEINDELISRAIDYGSFENMRRMEEKGVVEGTRLTVQAPGDSEAYKVRKGKVSGYKEYLSQSDIEYVNNRIIELLDPGFGY